MSFVIDARFIVKWLLQDGTREDDTAHATSLMRRIFEEGAEIVQPPHWLAEVAAVLVTADDRYVRAARCRGQVLRLADWARG